MTTSTTRCFALVLMLLAAAATGCADGATPIATDGPAYLGTERIAAGAAITTVDGLGRETVELDGSLCACTTDACRTEYVMSTIGCGVCLDVTCADGSSAGACTTCDDTAAIASMSH